jgi:hypothetical protein
MVDKEKLEKISKIKMHLVSAKAIAEEVTLPKLAYRGVDADRLKIDENMLSILKYIGNGCPNIYYAEDWGGMRILPEYYVAISTQLDQLISAMEMAGIQEDIEKIAPDIAAKIKKINK